MQFHTTVSWSVLHSAPVGLVMWNHKSTWKERSVLVPKAMEEAFKEVSSVGIVVKIVQRWKCWKVFGVAAHSECTVLHPHSLKDAHCSKVRGIELLSADCVLFYVEAMPPHLFHDQSYTEHRRLRSPKCHLHVFTRCLTDFFVLKGNSLWHGRFSRNSAETTGNSKKTKTKTTYRPALKRKSVLKNQWWECVPVLHCQTRWRCP